MSAVTPIHFFDTDNSMSRIPLTLARSFSKTNGPVPSIAAALTKTDGGKTAGASMTDIGHTLREWRKQGLLGYQINQSLEREWPELRISKAEPSDINNDPAPSEPGVTIRELYDYLVPEPKQLWNTYYSTALLNRAPRTITTQFEDSYTAGLRKNNPKTLLDDVLERYGLGTSFVLSEVSQDGQVSKSEDSEKKRRWPSQREACGLAKYIKTEVEERLDKEIDMSEADVEDRVA